MAGVTHDCHGLTEWLISSPHGSSDTQLPWSNRMTDQLTAHHLTWVTHDCHGLTEWLWPAHHMAWVRHDCHGLTEWLWPSHHMAWVTHDCQVPWSHRMTVISSPHGLSDTWLPPSNGMTHQLSAHHMAWVAQDCHRLTEQLWPAHHMAGMTRQHWSWARILDDLCRRHLKDHSACAALAAFVWDWVWW